MASIFSSQQAMHALFLLLPLILPLLLIPNASDTKHNNVCDYFKKGENVRKRASQENLLALLQDIGSHKVNDNMPRKEKFSSMLSNYGMNNVIVKSRVKQTEICYYTMALCACEFPSNKRRTGDSSTILATIAIRIGHGSATKGK